MLKQEITLKGLDGHEDHLVYDAADGQMNGSLEDCARSLFPAEGETTPRLRFQGFEGEWKLVRLGDVGTFKSNGVDKKIYPGESIVNLLNYMDVFNFKKVTKSNSKDLMLVSASSRQIEECDIKAGDVFFTPSSETAEDIGHVMVIEEDLPNTCYSYHLMRYRPNPGVFYPTFPDYGFQTRFLREQMRIAAKGVQRFVLGRNDFESLQVYVPCIEEQEKIATFFARLECEITLRKNQYEHLSQMKSACLGAMFPGESQITPPIRFSNFNEKWIMNKIGKLATTYSGGTPTAGVAEYYGGKIPFIRSGEIHQNETELYLTELGLKRSSAKLVCKGTILYAMYGATSGEVDISKVNGAINQAILAIIPNDALLSPFLSYLLQGRKKHIVDTYIQGGQGNLSGNLIKEYTIAYPSNISEQEQIASFFDNLDTQITAEQQQLNKLKQIKSACLRSMFPQNGGGNLPLIRFFGYNKPWIITKLSKFASRITRKNSQMETTLPLTISAAEGLIEQTAFFNNVVASSDVSGYYLIKKGEFAYNKSSSVFFPFGSIKRLERYEKGVLSTLYIVFSVNNSVSHDFLIYFFETTLWHQEISKRATEGARNHGLLNIGADDFLDIDILIPEDIEEQKRIASFFRSLDTKISLQTQRIEKLKQLKTACLSRMIA